MRKETIIKLVNEKGMRNSDLFIKFFMTRFPDESDRIYSYCNAWIDRFMSGDPTNYMDNDSLKIYLDLIVNGFSIVKDKEDIK